MITENQSLPKMEQLKQEEFDMGGEENMILEDMAKKVTPDHRHGSGGPLILLWSQWARLLIGFCCSYGKK